MHFLSVSDKSLAVRGSALDHLGGLLSVLSREEANLSIMPILVAVLKEQNLVLVKNLLLQLSRLVPFFYETAEFSEGSKYNQSLSELLDCLLGLHEHLSTLHQWRLQSQLLLSLS